MSFLANKCACGWSYDDLNDEHTLGGCVRCGRIYTKKNGYWTSTEPTKSVSPLIVLKDLLEYTDNWWWCYTSDYLQDRKEFYENLANKNIKST